MMKRILAAVLMLAIAGCATKARFQKQMDGLLGASEQSLVARMGPPQSVYDNAGTRILTYSQNRTNYIPGSAPTYQMIGNTAYPMGGSDPMIMQLSCTVNFTITDGLVQSYRFQGNNCVSR